jgi:hypothetical protein
LLTEEGGPDMVLDAPAADKDEKLDKYCICATKMLLYPQLHK